MENNEFIICKEKAEVVRMIFDCYLSGASLGKIADILSEKRITSPIGKERWTRAAIDKLLSNAMQLTKLLKKTFEILPIGQQTRT